MKRFHLVSFLTLAWLLALATPAAAGTTRSWVGPAGGEWFTTTYWSPNGTPAWDDTLILGSGDQPQTAGTVAVDNGGEIQLSSTANASLSNLRIGYTHVGTLTVQGGADLSSTYSYLGYYATGVGTATVSGSGSTWTTDGASLSVGYLGTGSLEILSSADVTSGTTYVGHADTSVGTVTLDGSGSTWSTASLYAGSSGDGTVVVRNDADLTTTGGAIGYNAGSVGRVTLDGSGSTWNTGPYNLYAGDGGDGTLEILNGADASVGGVVYVGYANGSTGTVTVDGFGSFLTSTGTSTGIRVGYHPDAVGTLNVQNDGQVSTIDSLSIGAKGAVNLSGGKLSARTLSGPADSLSFTGGELELTSGGVDISGSSPLGSYLNMASGQVLDVAGPVTVAPASTLRVNSASVESDTFTNEGSLYLAPGGSLSFGTGLVNRSYMSMGGGMVTGGDFTNDYGAMLYGQGTIQADLTNQGTLSVNDILTVTGGVENFGTIDVNYAGDSLRQMSGLDNYGTIDLDGGSISGSGWVHNYAGGVIRGGSSIGSALINFGLIHADGNSTLLISDFSGGNMYGGELRIDDGAGINVLNSFSSEGSILLKGADALLAGGDITNVGTIAGSGRVSNGLNNVEGGTIRASGGTLTLSGSVNNSGRIEALADASVFVSGLMVINDGTIALQGGGFDNNGKTLTNTGSITGHGVLRTGGLTNDNHMGVGVGDLEVLGDVVNDGSVDIQSGSTAVFYDDVSGSGSFDGLGTAMFLGALKPGSSAGKMSFAGNLVLGGGASLEIELGGTEAGVEHDVIEVALGTWLDGDLDVLLLDDFAPENGDIFDILDFDPLLLSGVFDAIHLPELSEGLLWNTSALYTSGAIRVVPEPSTFCLVALGCLLLGGIRRSGR